jgi:Na+-translocating ferredoxin:NAD+ oxidoreductase subunit C
MSRPPAVRGGLRLDAHKQRSTAQPLQAARTVDQYVLPLDQQAGVPAIPIVVPGERVLLGQPIAKPGGELSAWLHAPVSGTVCAIEPRPGPQTTGAVSPSIVIANDGRDERITAERVDFEQLSPRQLRAHIGRGGIVGLGGAAFPTAAKLDSCAGRDARILLNGAECEPYISCDDMLMRERAEDVVLGARILLRALDAASCTIAVEDDTPDAQQALRDAIARSEDRRIELAVVPGIYPAGGERQLITAVFDIEVPGDGLPADVGILCQNVGTAAAIAHWLRDGLPLIRRIVTVTGDGVQQARNLEVRIGTPIASLIADCGGYTPRALRLIMGGSMMGIALPHDELPVLKSSNCIIAASELDLQPRAPQMPCIRCGACADVCPAFLLPQQLHWYGLTGDTEALAIHGLMDCIECGCCDYVCPSQIPLAGQFHATKPVLAGMLHDRASAAAARARFEARNVRLQQLEAEQRAKLAEKRRRPPPP